MKFLFAVLVSFLMISCGQSQECKSKLNSYFNCLEKEVTETNQCLFLLSFSDEDHQLRGKKIKSKASEVMSLCKDKLPSDQTCPFSQKEFEEKTQFMDFNTMLASSLTGAPSLFHLIRFCRSMKTE